MFLLYHFCWNALCIVDRASVSSRLSSNLSIVNVMVDGRFTCLEFTSPIVVGLNPFGDHTPSNGSGLFHYNLSLCDVPSSDFIFFFRTFPVIPSPSFQVAYESPHLLRILVG